MTTSIRLALAASAALSVFAASALVGSPAVVPSAHAQEGHGNAGGQGNGNDAGGGQTGGAQEQNQNENQNQNQNQNQNRNRNGADEDVIDGAGVGVVARSDAAKLDRYACFHADPDFKGGAFCTVGDGHSDALAEAWNDRISSIEIVGSMTVSVCTEEKLTGTCAEFTASSTTLPAELDNAITSWRSKPGV